MSLPSSALSLSEQLALGSARQHGASSLLLSPLSFLTSAVGNVFGKKDLGTTILNKGLIDPSEAITRLPKYIRKIPGANLLFRQKLTPEDIVNASKHYNLSKAEVSDLIHRSQFGKMTPEAIAKLPQSQYRPTIFGKKTTLFSNDQINKIRRMAESEAGLNRQNVGQFMEGLGFAPGSRQHNKAYGELNKLISEGDLASYRLTKPFETVGKTIALPMLGGMYVHDKVNRSQKEALYQQQLENQLNQRFNNYSQFKGGSVNNKLNEDKILVKKAEITDAITKIEELSKIAGILKKQLDYERSKNGFYKEAAKLIKDGLLDPAQMDLWVEQQVSSPESYSKKSAEAKKSGSTIPGYANIGTLEEPREERNSHGKQAGGISAHQALRDFVFGG